MLGRESFLVALFVVILGNLLIFTNCEESCTANPVPRMQVPVPYRMYPRKTLSSGKVFESCDHPASFPADCGWTDDEDKESCVSLFYERDAVGSHNFEIQNCCSKTFGPLTPKVIMNTRDTVTLDCIPNGWKYSLSEEQVEKIVGSKAEITYVISEPCEDADVNC
mmetsp:Transcript_19749/g.27242  ORF Transcript_19749/g.27242 Transcript_19749/m.27242 type:complete len:165 (+) Transcript_19749:76-570(+)